MLTEWRQGDWDLECDDDGGRLTRVAWRGRELLTPPSSPPGGFRPPDANWGEYETRPVFGYDDCWPSLEVSAWPGRDVTVRDHGELCWLPWAVPAGDGCLLGTATDPAGEWTFTRELSCPEGALRFDFTCCNTGTRPLCMSWAGHALVPPGAMRDLALPKCEAVRRDFPSPSVSFGEQASSAWTYLADLPRGEAVMLVLEHCHSPVVELTLDGLRWSMAIEGIDHPSLGLWYNVAGYPPEQGLQREEFGIEWLLTPECLLDQAAQSGHAIVLPPQENLRWAVIWTIEETP